MAEVNHLEKGVDPPNGLCVVVARDVTGGFYVIRSEEGFHQTSAPAPAAISEDERTAAIERAKVYADQEGLKTVFVVS